MLAKDMFNMDKLCKWRQKKQQRKKDSLKWCMQGKTADCVKMVIKLETKGIREIIEPWLRM